MKIQDILRDKGFDVVTVPPHFPLLDAMRLLVKHNIGSLVVAEEKAVMGIITERDILRIGADDPQHFKRKAVEEVMTKKVVVGVPGDTVEHVMEIMTSNRIRHLPIVDDGWLEGILSIGDVVNALRHTVEWENQHLREYIAGKT